MPTTCVVGIIRKGQKREINGHFKHEAEVLKEIAWKRLD